MIPSLFLVLSVVFRVVPHPPNFAPVGALAVFAGRTTKPWMALLLVTLTMLSGDSILASVHGYPLFTLVTPFVYLGFFLQTLLGRALRARKGGAVVAALGGAVAFFLVSNIGVWVSGGLYPRSFAGLCTCFVAALPFFANTILGDVVWTVALSLAYRPLARYFAGREVLVPVHPQSVALL